jgi:2-polyprenyl-6-methoxyphenol hydroxylase-like FAD-dependent oxidoreductase
MIPGINGALAVGSRTVNWAWYCTYPSGSPELEELMTDTSSQRHRFSVPPGKVSPRIWTHQQALAAELLPADFAELVSKTTHPFVQLVTDVIASRASFFNGKVLLVGDALAGFRPHVFASTNQAALDALLLRDWLEGKTSLEEWEGSVLRYAREMSQSSIAIGQKIMFPESASKV